MSAPLSSPSTPVVGTGGGSGIGREVCRALAEVGRPIAAWDRNAEGAAETAQQCAALGVASCSAAVDVRDTDAIQAALAATLDALASGAYSPDDPQRYKDLVANLRHHDYFMVCADFEAYRATQRAVAQLWRNPDEWWRRAILNTAGMGWFSADRAILDYAREIWRAEPGTG